jgi:WD40 repeat protein
MASFLRCSLLSALSLSLLGCPEPKPTPPAATAEPARTAAASAAPPPTHAPGTVPAPPAKRAPVAAAKAAPTSTKIAPGRSRKAGVSISGARFLGKGARVALSRDGGLDLVDLPGGGGLALRHGSADAFVLSSDEARLALAGGGQVSLWDLGAGALLHTFADDATQVAFSADGARLALGGDSLLAVREVASGKELMRVKPDTTPFGLAFGAGDKELVVTAGNFLVGVFAADTGASRPGGGTADTGGTFGVSLSPDGRFAAASAPAGHGMQVSDVHAWAPRTLVTLPEGHCQEHIFAGFSADGRHLYAWGGQRWVKGFEVGNFKPYASYHAPPGRNVAAIADDLSRVVTAKEGGTDAALLTVSSAAETKLERPFPTAASYALSADGQRVAGWSGGELRVWSAKTGKVEYEEAP